MAATLSRPKRVDNIYGMYLFIYINLQMRFSKTASRLRVTSFIYTDEAADDPQKQQGNQHNLFFFPHRIKSFEFTMSLDQSIWLISHSYHRISNTTKYSIYISALLCNVKSYIFVPLMVYGV